MPFSTIAVTVTVIIIMVYFLLPLVALLPAFEIAVLLSLQLVGVDAIVLFLLVFQRNVLNIDVLFFLPCMLAFLLYVRVHFISETLLF